MPAGAAPPPAEGRWRFGRFELQRAERRLLADGSVVPLGARALDLLIVLAARAGQLLTRDELIERVWPGRVVEENNLSVQINALRKALGNDVVATVPGYGYRFVARIEAATGRAVVAAAAPALQLRTRLPGRLATLIGRGDELAALQALVDRQPLVCITGAGGTGKTLLAQTLLLSRRDTYEHGVCLVELAPLGQPEALPAAIAAALGLPWTECADPVAALARALAPLQLLLALDNAEHLVDAVAAIAAALLAQAPRLRLLVTSQVRLKLADERVFGLAPLAVPQRSCSAATARAYGAVALFVERAQAIDHRFTLQDDNVAAVIDLCRGLDGSALAIELAAARLPLLGLAGLMQSLARPLQVLTQGRHDAPARQRTLRAAIEWSHGLLGPVEQAVFRRLAVFVGGASLAVARQLLTDSAEDSADEWAMLDALGGLVDRSLVAMVADGADDEPRYRLLESPLALAQEKLQASEEGPPLQQRHAWAVRALLERAQDALFDGELGFDRLVAGLAPDIDNVHAALRWALQHDAAAALALAPVLSLLLGAERHGERSAMWRQVEPLLDLPAPPRLLARAALQCADHLGRTRPELGRSRAQQARAWALAAADGATAYQALASIAATSWRLRDLAPLQEAAITARRDDHAGWSPYVRSAGAAAQAWLCCLQGDHDGAIAGFSRQAELRRAAGLDDALTLNNVAGQHLAAGHTAEAVALTQALVERSSGGRDLHRLCTSLINLSAALLSQDDAVAAKLVARRSWPLVAQFEMVAEWADDSALIAALEGRPEAALRLAGYADAFFVAHGQQREQVDQVRADRTLQLARTALEAGPGRQPAGHWLAEGAMLRLQDLPALAFGTA